MQNVIKQSQSDAALRNLRIFVPESTCLFADSCFCKQILRQVDIYPLRIQTVRSGQLCSGKGKTAWTAAEIQYGHSRLYTDLAKYPDGWTNPIADKKLHTHQTKVEPSPEGFQASSLIAMPTALLGSSLVNLILPTISRRLNAVEFCRVRLDIEKRGALENVHTIKSILPSRRTSPTMRNPTGLGRQGARVANTPRSTFSIKGFTVSFAYPTRSK